LSPNPKFDQAKLYVFNRQSALLSQIMKSKQHFTGSLCVGAQHRYFARPARDIKIQCGGYLLDISVQWPAEVG
jgi:hypothetical protein